MTVTSIRNAALVCWSVGWSCLRESKGRISTSDRHSQTCSKEGWSQPSSHCTGAKQKDSGFGVCQLWVLALALSFTCITQSIHTNRTQFLLYRASVKSREERSLPRPAECVSSLTSIGMRPSLGASETKGELSSMSIRYPSCPPEPIIPGTLTSAHHVQGST